MTKVAKLVCFLLASTFAIPAHAQASDADAERIERKLDELRAMREDMQRQMGTLQQQMGQFDNQIEALEQELGVEPPPVPSGTSTAASSGTASPATAASNDTAMSTITAGVQTAEAPPADGQSQGGVAGFMERKERVGKYDPNLGFIVADDPDNGMLAISFTTYVRYLNQNGLNDTYVDSFGRTNSIDVRNEFQLNKVSLNFKGWLFDPKFQYLLFAWTNNANQGESAQVVLAGFLRYKFADWLAVTAGIMPLPTTRSTNWSFPKWLRHDNRVMADEFYRGSYTSGIDIAGKITDGLEYRAMLGNNLSTLGVSSRQMDNKLDTYSGALWWMPTTGEFGSSNGFGDYDYHEEVATFLGAYYTHSTETRQGQPTDDGFENSQIRLTDGTLLFSRDPFNSGTNAQVDELRYRMASVDAGVKYKGFSLEGQWYWRTVDNFKMLNGTFPVGKISDNGFVLQASAMPVKDLLQVYGTASKIWGDQGNPTEFSFGVNVYPFKRREMHVNLQAIKLNRSPVGGYHMPVPVGGDGWVFLTDWVVMF